MKNLDALVKEAIGHHFPGGTVPDENNSLPTGAQFKAPDHSVLKGNVLIERKSLNPENSYRFYERLKKIAEKQDAPFRGYGLIRADRVIENLPNPEHATCEITDYLLSRLEGMIGKARKKFLEYMPHAKVAEASCVLCVADHFEMESATDSAEYFIGRQFVRQRAGQINLDPIDAIIYLKHPNHVIDDENSYWFKCIIRSETATPARELIRLLSITIHNYVAAQLKLTPCRKFEKGAYRPLLA